MSFEDAVGLTDGLRAVLDELVGEVTTSASDEWEAAFQRAIAFARLIQLNNPSASTEQILARPDIQQALSWPFDQATPTSRVRVETAWAAGWTEGAASAQSMLEAVGISPQAVTDAEDNETLDRLRTDVAVQAHDANMLLTEHFGETALEDAVASGVTRRAELTAETAARRAATEAALRTFEESGVSQVVWVSRLAANTCPACLALHGKTVLIGSVFDWTAWMPGATGGPPPPWQALVGPPRHPHCRCRLAPYVESSDEQGFLATLIEAAKAAWAALKGAA